MLEAIFEVIVEVILIGIFVYPGAVIRWLISRLWRSKKPFKGFVKDHPYWNGMLGLITSAALGSLIYQWLL